MYKCICGYKTSYKSSMESHLRFCSVVKNKLKSSSDSNCDDSILTAAALANIMDSYCSYDSPSSYGAYSSSSSDYSGGGGSFDGGGSSGDW